MTRIHIAGELDNAQACYIAADRLMDEGLEVTNPIDCADTPAYWRACIAALVTCDEIALLPFWSESKGATLEAEIARRLGLKVRFLDRAGMTL